MGDDREITARKGLEGVRRRPGMYVGDVDHDGLHKLVWELVGNALVQLPRCACSSRAAGSTGAAVRAFVNLQAARRGRTSTACGNPSTEHLTSPEAGAAVSAVLTRGLKQQLERDPTLARFVGARLEIPAP